MSHQSIRQKLAEIEVKWEQQSDEIKERTKRVREAKIRALQQGYVAPSAADLTAVLGDTQGAARAEVERATRRQIKRKRGN